MGPALPTCMTLGGIDPLKFICLDSRNGDSHACLMVACEDQVNVSKKMGM